MIKLGAQAYEPPKTQIEKYGTSWMRDLMQAKNSALPAFQTSLPYSGSRFTGATDANYGHTLGGHSTHGAGMSFGLSITNFVTGIYLAASTVITPAIASNLTAQPTDGSWSNQYALDLNNLSVLTQDGNTRAVLPNAEPSPGEKNYQVDALYDFLALYSVTRDNGNEANGWDNLNFENGGATAQTKLKIRTALFGDGTKEGSLIKSIHIGGDATEDEAIHQRMRDVLTALDIDNSARTAHHNHFHLNLRPPKPIKIEGDNNRLVAKESDVQDSSLATLDQQNDHKFDAEFSQCTTLANTDDPHWRTLNGVGPSSAGLTYFMSRGLEFDISTWKSKVVVGPQKGELEAVIEKSGATFDHLYIPKDGDSGPDQMIYILEAEGKRFRVIESVYVAEGIPENGHEGCESGFGVEELKKTVRDINGSSLDIMELAVGSMLSAEALTKLHQHVSFSLRNVKLPASSEIAFADIANGGLGQASGNNITLDDDANGYGWFTKKLKGTPALKSL